MDTLTGALKSKTVWFGLLLAVLSWLQSVLNSSGLSADQLAIIGPVLGAVVVWLRSVTSVPLSEK